MEKLIEMCALNSVSGNEFKMTEYIKKYTESFCDSVEADALGNVVAVLNNNSDTTSSISRYIR